MDTPFYFFFILVLVVAVQWTEVEGECTNIVGVCTEKSCPLLCDAFGAGSKVTGFDCVFNNLCTCTFEEPSKGATSQPKCDFGIGLCTTECGSDCCNTLCVEKFPDTGAGVCVQNYGLNYCSCYYNR